MANEKEIINEFHKRREALSVTWNKVGELSAEVAEHELVLKALAPMDAKRKCFRLIGEVLVERTVGETMPAVSSNKAKLEEVIKTLQETAKTQEKELAEFQAKYKLRVVQKGEQEQEAGPSGSANAQAQGVLVD